VGRPGGCLIKDGGEYLPGGGGLMDFVNVYLLTSLNLDSKGDVTSRNVGITFSLHEAEAHRDKGVENEFERFQIDSNWQEDAATTELVIVMREFREIVALQIQEALR
jgi:hypothetical protein